MWPSAMLLAEDEDDARENPRALGAMVLLTGIQNPNFATLIEFAAPSRTS